MHSAATPPLGPAQRTPSIRERSFLPHRPITNYSECKFSPSALQINRNSSPIHRHFYDVHTKMLGEIRRMGAKSKNLIAAQYPSIARRGWFSTKSRRKFLPPWPCKSDADAVTLPRRGPPRGKRGSEDLGERKNRARREM